MDRYVSFMSALQDPVLQAAAELAPLVHARPAEEGTVAPCSHGRHAGALAWGPHAWVLHAWVQWWSCPSAQLSALPSLSLSVHLTCPLVSTSPPLSPLPGAARAQASAQGGGRGGGRGPSAAVAAAMAGPPGPGGDGRGGGRGPVPTATRAPEGPKPVPVPQVRGRSPPGGRSLPTKAESGRGGWGVLCSM